jgi:hypothetical protein
LRPKDLVTARRLPGAERRGWSDDRILRPEGRDGGPQDDAGDGGPQDDGYDGGLRMTAVTASPDSSVVRRHPEGAPWLIAPEGSGDGAHRGSLRPKDLVTARRLPWAERRGWSDDRILRPEGRDGGPQDDGYGGGPQE